MEPTNSQYDSDLESQNFTLYAPNGTLVERVLQAGFIISDASCFSHNGEPRWMGTDFTITGSEEADGQTVVVDKDRVFWPIGACKSFEFGKKPQPHHFDPEAKSPLPQRQCPPYTLLILRGGWAADNLGYFETEEDIHQYKEAMLSGDYDFSPEQLGFGPYDTATDSLLVIKVGFLGEVSSFVI